MSNVVGASIALCFAVLWVVFDTFVDVVRERVEKGFKSISERFFSLEEFELRCSAADVLVSQRQVIERFVTIIEREVEWSQQRTRVQQTVLVVFDHPQLFLLIVCAIFFLCSLRCHLSHQPRRPRDVSARKPNPRPVLQRDGGALS